MQWSHQIDTWIVVVGMLSAMPCALLGSFLVLRRMSMMGDAISHAVLPGLAAAFFLSGSRASASMFIGAAIVGVLTALLTEWVRALGRVDEGASMGIVFTTLFAIGLIMIVRAANHVDLDPGCVLYGAIELIPLDCVTVGFVGLGPWDIPRAALVLGGVLLLDALVVLVLYKEFKITSFDPALATTLGYSSRVLHYVLMTLVAITTVAAFESVGSILVIAMLIVPAASARLLTDRFGVMLVLSMVVGACAAGLGHVAAITVPPWFGFESTSTAGMMAFVLGLVFLLAMMFAPHHGMLAKVRNRLALRFQILREDILGLLFRADEVRAAGKAVNPPDLMAEAFGFSRFSTRLAVWSLRSGGHIDREKNGAFRLTDQGRERAAALVRTHRLWEAYLAKFTALKHDHLHEPATRLEHLVEPGLSDELAQAVGDVQTDPHGKDIPGLAS